LEQGNFSSSYSSSVSNPNTNKFGVPDCNPVANSYSNTNSYPNTYSFIYPNTYSFIYTDTYSFTDTY
jgi:hypothetical protein